MTSFPTEKRKQKSIIHYSPNIFFAYKAKCNAALLSFRLQVLHDKWHEDF